MTSDGGVAGQEDRGADELLGPSQAVAQHAVDDEVAGDGGRLVHPLDQRRVHERRRDGVDAHVAIPPLQGQPAGELHDAALGLQVGDRVRVGDERADRGDVDDRPALLGEHDPAERLAGQEAALQVQRDQRVVAILGEVLGRRAEGRAGAVHQHVHLAVLGHDGLGRPVDGRAGGDVADPRGGRRRPRSG